MRRGPRRERHGFGARDRGIAVQERQRAAAVPDVKRPATLEPREHRGREGAQVRVFRERPRVAEPSPAAVLDLFAGDRHPGGEDRERVRPVDAALDFDAADGAVRLAVVAGEKRRDGSPAGDGPGEHDDVGA